MSAYATIERVLSLDRYNCQPSHCTCCQYWRKVGKAFCQRSSFPAINTLAFMGITNTAESKLLTAKTIMNKFVVVRSRLFLQIEIQTKVVPIRDKIFKVMSKLTSTTIKLRPRNFKSSGIIDTKTPTLASN